MAPTRLPGNFLDMGVYHCVLDQEVPRPELHKAPWVILPVEEENREGGLHTSQMPTALLIYFPLGFQPLPLTT